MVRELEFLEPLTVSLLTQRRDSGPEGAHGGESGSAGEQRLRRAGADAEEKLPSCVRIDVQPGDCLILCTPGGGGWGAPDL